MPKDVLVGRVEDLDNLVLRLFIKKNRLRWKDCFSILARLVLDRSAIAKSPGFDALDDEFKRWLVKRASEGDDRARGMLERMDFVSRYLGFGLRSVTRVEFKAIQEELMQDELERMGE